MSEVANQKSDIYFGDPEQDKIPDWREDNSLVNETDPDDEELSKTPPDVIAVLGFDPLDL